MQILNKSIQYMFINLCQIEGAFPSCVLTTDLCSCKSAEINLSGDIYGVATYFLLLV